MQHQLQVIANFVQFWIWFNLFFQKSYSLSRRRTHLSDWRLKGLNIKVSAITITIFLKSSSQVRLKECDNVAYLQTAYLFGAHPCGVKDNQHCLMHDF